MRIFIQVGGKGETMNGKDGWVRLQREDFSIQEEIERVRGASRRIGGVVAFLGTAREFSRGKEVERLVFEVYPPMAQKKLEELRRRAKKRFGIVEVGIVHRHGEIGIGENIVLVVAGAEHRKEAFEACRWCIDELKRIAPIWKKEITTEGSVWIEEHP
jgi:molybdopterin synthase catalytic subunit